MVFLRAQSPGRTMLAAVAFWGTSLLASRVLAGDVSGFPFELNRRPLTLPEGMNDIGLGVTGDVSARSCCRILIPSYRHGITDRLQFDFPLELTYRLPSHQEPRIQAAIFGGGGGIGWNTAGQFVVSTEIGAFARVVFSDRLAFRTNGGLVWNRRFGTAPPCPAGASAFSTCSQASNDFSPWIGVGLTFQPFRRVAISANDSVTTVLAPGAPGEVFLSTGLGLTIIPAHRLDLGATVHATYWRNDNGAHSTDLWLSAGATLRW